jgi:hypothetical protein
MVLIFVLGTTDSTASEEDLIPPPLPQKSREADYCNLPDKAEPVLLEPTWLPTPRVRNKVRCTSLYGHPKIYIIVAFTRVVM